MYLKPIRHSTTTNKSLDHDRGVHFGFKPILDQLLGECAKLDLRVEKNRNLKTVHHMIVESQTEFVYDISLVE